MNKRGPTGLPTKPYMQNNGPGPGPAPPLPAGPPPQMQQQQYPQGQVDQAAHAAAWAAYYQAQGVNPAAASYSAAPQPATPVQAAQGTPNPYANYGYGGGAQHAGYQPALGQQAGPSQPFRPPPNTQAYATTTSQPSLGYQQPGAYGQQSQVYSPNPTAGYSTPQPQQPIQAQGRPPFAQQQQQQQQPNYNWGAQQPQQQQPMPPQQPQGGYGRPPPVQQQPVAQPYPQQSGPVYPQQPQQQPPFAGPAGNNQPFRPTGPAQHSPYRPPLNQHRPPRPPISTPVGGGFPPAKRPRFDGPGGIRPPNGPMQMQMQSQSQNSPTPNIRPPSAPAAFNAGTAGVNGGQPGFGNAGVTVASRGGMSGSTGRGGAPIPPSRPPIHLGGGGPPPFGIGLGRGGSLRGGLAGRGARGGSVGVVGAPRGPSGMRVGRSSLPPAPVKKDVHAHTHTHTQTPKKEKRKEELRTTMTDFRIVGIEVRGLGWSWGKMGGDDEGEEEVKPEVEANTQVDDISVPVPGENENKVEDLVDAKQEITEESGSTETLQETTKEEINGSGEEVKVESSEVNGNGGVSEVTENGIEAVEEKEKRGEKRKAKSPDSEEETAAKKRNSSYLLTHNKPNHPVSLPESSSSTSANMFQSNQNRFRIYFDSPPELDRIPKSARRKRGRESSSVAPSRAGEEVEHEAEAEAQVEPAIKEEVIAGEGAQVQEEGAETVAEEHPEIVDEGQTNIEGEQLPEVIGPVLENSEIVGVAQPTAAESDFIEPSLESQDPAAQPEPSAEQNHGQSENLEEFADVSMITDSGLAITAEEAIPSSEPTPLDGPAAAEAVDAAQDVPAEAEFAQAESIEQQASTGPDQPAESTDTSEQLEQIADEVVAQSIETPAVETITTNTVDSEYQAEGSATVMSRRHSNAITDYQSTVVGETAPPTSTVPTAPKSVPSTNRLSILYEKSSRRICIDSDVVEKVKIWRAEGKIEVCFKHLTAEGEAGLPKGILVESYDSADQRYITLTSATISSFFVEPDYTTPNEEGKSIPPFHRFSTSSSSIKAELDNENKSENEEVNARSGAIENEGLVLVVHLNKKNPLSEPKWCRNNSADNWLYEQFGSRRIEKDEEAGDGFGTAGWKGKLEVMDPDPPPTLQSILENWQSTSSYGTTSTRNQFIASLLDNPLDTLEILLRLTRGDRNPIYSSNPSSFTSFNQTIAIRKDSPYTNNQTHVSLAVLAMYRLTTDLIEKMALTSTSTSATDEEEKLSTQQKEKDKLNESVNEIIASLPNNMILRSLDGLWKEWNSHNSSSSSSKGASGNGK
ncbi:uncharacterized protein I303_107617 [Kwoniella dejecticola CBS 10117]|uniref:Uncharacterized protein n=1 Tax=Kwoniella dejecticola CBS 10117 TaxID=1296121 RepID=A0AAJ8MKT2_9TREE